MKVVDIRERSVPISRYTDPSIASGGLTTSIVAVTLDVQHHGRPVIGYGFGSIGRFAQGGLIRERFAPRLLAAELAEENGHLDPFRGWRAMMQGEKPGGHGERCVAVGTLDMALWDAAAKLKELPLHRLLAKRLPMARPAEEAAIYASGGYLYPSDDLARLSDEVRRLLGDGYTHFKIKIGAAPLKQDVKRIETVLALLPGADHLAVDAMNAYDAAACRKAATALAPYRLRWFEDIGDPHDFATQAAIAADYAPPIAAGEALFSAAEARLLDRHGGLRRERDILLFDPVHCYGLPGFLEILATLETAGWKRSAFWPHGGHLFALHLAAALGLGGGEMNPLSFHPFGGLGDGVRPVAGRTRPPEAPGVGFEEKAELRRLLATLQD